jgi:catechol 2,3-dioxygenase-like lactoylglutathione lyase family enzyme
MNTDYLEHANLTVKDIDAMVHFIRSALPGWRVRGQGTMDWFGKTIRWLHVGTDTFYIALQDGGEGEGPHWATHHAGLKHLGLVVPSADDVVRRLEAAGYALDHWGGITPHRRSVYFIAHDGLQFEFVEYLSADIAERNAYAP